MVRSFPQDEDSQWQSKSDYFGCLPDEAKVVLVLRFDIDPKRFEATNRIRLLQTVSLFIQSLNRYKNDRCDITMDRDDHLTRTAFLSGEGSIDGTPLNNPGVSVYWTIGCTTDKLELSVLNAIEKAAQNGSMTQLTGYDVVEWRVENWKPYSLHSNPKQRLKRYVYQMLADVFSTYDIRNC